MAGEQRTDSLYKEIEAFLLSKGITKFLVAFEDPDSDCYAMGKRGDLWALGAATAIREKLIAQQFSGIDEEKDI